MLGSCPGIFKNLEAAKLAGKAYAMERGKPYIIIEQWGIYDETRKNMPSGYYDTCEKEDLTLAHKEGYEFVCDCE